MTPGRRAVFLDRDGVIVEAFVRGGRPHSPGCLAELVIPPETKQCLDRLKERGFLLIVVTNQPEVARGTLSSAVLESMHQYIRRQLPLDEILVCHHDDADDCPCRKPRPGLILEAGRRHGIALELSFLIGDRWRDVEAGGNAGCTTILIDFGYREREPDRAPGARVSSLREATDWILARTPPKIT